MRKTKATRERIAKAAALEKSMADDKRREQKREEKRKRNQEARWKEKLERYHQDLRRRRGETLTREQVRLVLSMYNHYFLDEEVPEDELHKVHLVTGISKIVLDGVLEDWEHRQEIRVFDAARRSSVAAKRGKAPLATSTCLQQYVDKKVKKGGLFQL